ncbi:hypothetical protein MASR1M90_19540 [Desulfovibrionales bacterium]
MEGFLQDNCFLFTFIFFPYVDRNKLRMAKVQKKRDFFCLMKGAIKVTSEAISNPYGLRIPNGLTTRKPTA